MREIQPANGWKVVVVDSASVKLLSRWTVREEGQRGSGLAGEAGRGGESVFACMHACGVAFVSMDACRSFFFERERGV